MRYVPGVALVSLVIHTACGGDSGPTNSTPTCTVTSVTVNASSTAITTTTSSTLTAKVNANASCSGGVNWTAAPSGGTLTASGLTATFGATTAGNYTITATSSADPSKSASAIITVTAGTSAACGTANGTVVNHTTNIAADETWGGDGVTHVVPSSIAVNGSAVLTIQPCAIVALAQGVSITVNSNAHLVAAGTSASRFVLFRRNNASQAWGTIRGTSPTSLIDLTWTTLQGGGNFGGMNDPTLAAFGNGYATLPARVVRVNNVAIQGSQGVGVYLDASSGFTTDSQLLTITGSGGRPINTTMMSLGTFPTGTYTGNALDEVLIFGNPNVFSDLTIQDLGIPIRSPFGSISIASTGGAAAAVTLTLKPGVILTFPKLPPNQPGARVTFGTNGNSPNNLVGVLNAIGTAAKPIIFTSGETTPAAGDWVGLWLNTANGSRLDFVEINYAGGASGISSTNCRLANTPDYAALTVGDFETQYVPPSNLITNSKITNSAGYGINAMWQAPVFNSVDLTPTNTFTSNARCKQTYNGLTPPGVCPAGGGCTAP